MMKSIAIIASILMVTVMCLHSAGAVASDTTPAQQSIAFAGSQGSAKGPSEFFTGNVRVDPLYPADTETNFSAAYVTFEPGARSNWHTHPCGQRLIVVAGVGLTQVWGGPIVEIKPGDVVSCPKDVKHWHGASPTTGMTHISMAGTTPDGKSVVWMERVTDEQYRAK